MRMHMPGPGHRNPMERRQETATNKRQTLRRLSHYVVRHYRLALLTAALCIVFSAAATLASTLFTRTLIDDYILPLVGTAAPNFAPLLRALCLLGLVLLVGVAASFVSARLMIRVSQGTMRRLRREMFFHLQQLPTTFFDRHARGDVMSNFTNDIDTLRQCLAQSMPQMLSSLVGLVITFAAMVALSLPLTAVSLLIALLIALSTKHLSLKAKKAFKAQQDSLGAMNAYVEEMVTGQKVVKMFGREAQTIAGFDRLDAALQTAASTANATANVLMPVNANLGNLGYVLIAVVGAFLALYGEGTLTLGTMVAFLALNRNFTQPIAQISQQFNSIVQASAGAERIFLLLDETEENDAGTIDLAHSTDVAADRSEVWMDTSDLSADMSDVPAHASDVSIRRTPVCGSVIFRNVSFAYVPDHPVLHDICFDVLPGQKIAIVGGTGAGKTTLINLLARFCELQAGSILIDGIDIRRIRKHALRRALGMVLQDTHLFSGTVMDNLRYGRDEATDEECRTAARLVGADAFIRRLPKGYFTRLKRAGAALSRGERQLLCIARAAVANPPLLILDEATSSVDTRTERIVQQGMDSLMQGRTTFVIAHRLSTVRSAHCILVLENGCIVERGTHEDLMQQRGRYFQLCNASDLGEV